VGQRTFETRSLYLILAEMLFTLPAANEMLPLSALFAGKYRSQIGLTARFEHQKVPLRPTQIATLKSGHSTVNVARSEDNP
jgi:hypothetical protein